jgi:quercetin dioxygenase-like cupin family protein
MRKDSALAALLIAVPFVLGAQPAATPAGRARDAVTVDPTHHQVILENDHVRVIRGLVAPGDRSAMHTHPPTVLVSLGTSRARMTDPKGATSIFDLQPGQVFWLDGAEHSWQMLAGTLHVIGVEIKSAARGAAPAAVALPSTDAVKVDPVGHQVVVDNPHVRVIEGLSGAGRRSPMHSHSYALTIISLGRGRLNLTMPDGNSAVVDVHPGQVLWLEGGSHSWEVVSGISNLIAIEVKSAPAK